MAGARVQVHPQEGQKWQKMVFTVDRPNCALEEMRRGQREGDSKGISHGGRALTSRTQDLLLASMRVVMPEADALSTAPGDRFKRQF